MAPDNDKSRLDDVAAAGHYMTTGVALAAFGSFAMLLGVLLSWVIKLDLRFIDGPAMIATSAVLIGLGAWLTWHGNTLRGRATTDATRSAAGT